MTRKISTSLTLLAAAVLAGCSTAPTITVPNPLAAFNGMLKAPAYSTQAAVPASTQSYINTQPASVGTSYGVAAPNYTVQAPSYGIQAPNYAVQAPGYAIQAPTYSASIPASTSTFSATAPSVATPTYGAVTAPASYSIPAVQAQPVTVAPSYGTTIQSYGQQALPMTQLGSVSQPAAPTFGTVQPTQIGNPVSMGGSFQTVPTAQPTLGGIAQQTYQGVTGSSVPTSASLPGGVTISY